MSQPIPEHLLRRSQVMKERAEQSESAVPDSGSSRGHDTDSIELVVTLHEQRSYYPHPPVPGLNQRHAKPVPRQLWNEYQAAVKLAENLRDQILKLIER
jgi:hypothetical protein